LMWCLSRWTDGALFDLAVKIVLGSAGDALPADFAEDRGRLYLGPDWAAGLKAANADLPHLAAQMWAPLRWLDDLLADGRRYLTGAAPGAFDAQMYHVIWFLRGRWANGPAFLDEFVHLCQWELATAELGHGNMRSMDAKEAHQIAASHEPATPQGVSPSDPQGLVFGARVVASSDVDGGEQPVAGTIWSADAKTVALLRHDNQCGALCVHFPRAGYRITTGQ
jgi:hypothetical protein